MTGDDVTRPISTPDRPAAGRDAGPVLEVENLQHAYRRTVALRGVSLGVAPGEVVAVTGPSGCGKSTLLHAAAGLLRPASGTVRLFGRDVAGLDDTERARLRRTDLALVLQFGQLVDELTGTDNVALPLLLDGHDPAEARELARHHLARCGAEDVADAVPPDMSGGQAQRVAVARALVTSPRLVLADEPTGSLDSLGGRALLDLLLAETGSRGTALVVVTHDNTVAARAHREVRLLDGAIASEAVLA
jgi:putative ABC transport system ATP-binding protein